MAQQRDSTLKNRVEQSYVRRAEQCGWTAAVTEAAQADWTRGNGCRFFLCIQVHYLCCFAMLICLADLMHNKEGRAACGWQRARCCSPNACWLSDPSIQSPGSALLYNWQKNQQHTRDNAFQTVGAPTLPLPILVPFSCRA